jgi:hypothetical protein
MAVVVMLGGAVGVNVAANQTIADLQSKIAAIDGNTTVNTDITIGEAVK